MMFKLSFSVQSVDDISEGILHEFMISMLLLFFFLVFYLDDLKSVVLYLWSFGRSFSEICLYRYF